MNSITSSNSRTTVALQDQTHIVIDLETLDTSPSAVVTSIGVAIGSKGAFTSWQVNLEITSQLLNGRTVSQSTLAWWKEQQKYTQQLMLENQLQTPQALSNLVIELEGLQVKLGESNIAVWGNSPSFDLVILSSLFEQYRSSVPWKYWQERDLRTYGAMVGVSFNEWKQQQENSFVAHCAKEDAMAELKYLFTYLPSSAGE